MGPGTKYVSVQGFPSVHSLFKAVSTGRIVFKEHVLNKKQLPGPRHVMCGLLSVIACFCGLHLSASQAKGVKENFHFINI